MDQVKFLRLLLFHMQSVNRHRYVSSREAYNNLNDGRHTPIQEHYFRTKIIAALRDDGVLIASSSRGYKLPTRSADLYDFVNHGSQMIKPMLDRIDKCRKHIKLSTKNRLDILDRKEYTYLRRLIDDN